MTYELAAWYSDSPVDDGQASQICHHLNTDWVILRRHPDFNAFMVELATRCPDLTSGATERPHDDLPFSFVQTMADLMLLSGEISSDSSAAGDKAIFNENSPWARNLSPQGCSIVLSISSGRAGDIEDIVYDLARKHGLVFYNPQSGKVSLPERLRSLPAVLSVDANAKVTIRGKGKTLTGVITISGREVLSGSFPTRTMVHRAAREAALQAGEILYEFHDPACLAQCMKFPPPQAGAQVSSGKSHILDLLTGFQAKP